MTMRKKDYEAIARAINVSHIFLRDDRADKSVRVTATLTAERVANHIADYCATQDPTFKRDRFLADCGVSQS